MNNPNKLSPKERAILEVLDAGELTPCNVLVQRVWGYWDESAAHAVRVHISTLRKKIAPDRIRSVRRTDERDGGYQLIKGA